MTRDEAVDALIELLAEQIVEEHFAEQRERGGDPLPSPDKDLAPHDERV